MAILTAGWLPILQLLAILSIVAVALGLMLGMVKPGDALKPIGAILVMIIILMLLPGILIGTWSRLLLWQKLGLSAIVAVLWFLRQAQRLPRDKHRN